MLTCAGHAISDGYGVWSAARSYAKYDTLLITVHLVLLQRAHNATRTWVLELVIVLAGRLIA
jgi:hypothetical protein